MYFDVASDSSGESIVVVGQNEIIFSSDGGSTWNPSEVADYNYIAVVSDSTGHQLVAVGNGVGSQIFIGNPYHADFCTRELAQCQPNPGGRYPYVTYNILTQSPQSK